MAAKRCIAVLALLLAPTTAHVSTGRPGHGIIGYGISMYDPGCAYACRSTVSGWMLECDDGEEGTGHSHSSGMEMAAPSPLCYATNDPFLQTLAWCISTHCQGVPVSKLEKYWQLNVAGRQTVQPSPKYSYQVALAKVVEPPTTIVDSEEVLNTTSLVDEESYLANANGNNGFEAMEILAERYGLVLILTCVLIPIIFSWFRFLPLPQSLVSKFYATVIDPPVFGKYHAVPVLGLGFIPTRGQAIFIAYIWLINIILSAAGWVVLWPNSWYSDRNQALKLMLANRIGLHSFVNLAIAVLFSSRNNLLLFVTNWSYSTYLLVHRWVGVICMLQACLHSVIWLQDYVALNAHAAEAALEYWYWGIIATLALSIMTPLAVLPLRRKLYELFLSTHLALALLSMIGCLLHIYYRFEWQWGYETWVIIAFGFWGFDRVFARPLRLVKNGVKKAYVAVVDEDYLKINIPDVDVSGQAFLYFPTLTWRVWENHPFSVAAISSHHFSEESSSSTRSLNAGTAPSEEHDIEKSGPAARSVAVLNDIAPGVVFYVRRQGGLTAHLMKHAEFGKGIPVLVEASYGPEQMSIVASPTTHPTLQYPNVICIAGGVGITGVLPSISGSNGLLYGKTKLFWGVRTAPLVRSVEQMLGVETATRGGKSQWGHVEVSVSVGPRFNFNEVLTAEIAALKGGTTVVVCGPAGMADEVRSVVTTLGKTNTIRFVTENFFW